MSRRLLLISRHFGDYGATGGFRWARTVAHLSAHGWTTSVVTASNSPWDSDDRHVDWMHVPAARPLGNCVARVRASLLSIARLIKRSASLAGFREKSLPLTVVPGNAQASLNQGELLGKIEALRIPGYAEKSPFWATLSRLAEHLDHALWARKAYRNVLRCQRSGRQGWDVVVVSSPPHWTQLAGLWIGGRLGIPFVCDFRDPWISALTDECVSDSILTRINLALERRILAAADLSIFNTGKALQLSRARLSHAGAAKSIAIGNGYDAPPRSPESLDFHRFRVVFAGHIYHFMDIRVVFKAFRRLVDELNLSPGKASLELLGSGRSFNGVDFDTMARAYGLEDYFERIKRIPRDEALEYQARAAVLVAMDYPYPSAVVMKAYDYLCMPGLILALTREGSALSQLLSELGLEWYRYEDQAGIRQFLVNCYQRWLARDMQPVKDPLGKHVREARSREIREALESVCGSS